MRIAWATDYEGVGNAYGFTLGNGLGRQAALDAGIVIDPEADVAVHHCPPHAFRPLSGRFNVLWTAWEFAELPPNEVEGLRRADAVFATARFLVEVFEKASGLPTFCVPQGIRTELFAEAARPRPARPGVARDLAKRPPFRFLWVGAPNDRKGWRHVMGAWRAFANDPTCELYVKTTFAGGALEGGRWGNVIIDTDKRSDEGMASVYHAAHAFVFPSMGEGFGFTLGEAMATGLPCLYTPATALAELCPPGCGYPLRYERRRCFELNWAPGRRMLVEAADADVDDLARRMAEVRQDYAEALRRGRLAARHVRERFTWARAGRALKEALAAAAAAGAA